MARPHVVLIHGAATTASVYAQTAKAVSEWARVSVPQRACSGDLGNELHDLAPVCRDAVVVGVSGGATLALALQLSGLPMAAVVAHEPAVGSWAPGLLDAVRAAYETDGVPGFGAALYGPAWSPEMAPDHQAVARDLAMFSAFEPSTRRWPTPLFTSVGQRSPVARHTVARLVQTRLGAQVIVVPDAAHAVHLETPATFARIIHEVWTQVSGKEPTK